MDQWKAIVSRLGLLSFVCFLFGAMAAFFAQVFMESLSESSEQRVYWIGGMLFALAVVGLLAGINLVLGFRRSLVQLSVPIHEAAKKLEAVVGRPSPEIGTTIPELEHVLQTLAVQVEEVVESLRHRQQEVLRAGQMSALGQLAASLAHELRNPLTSIRLLVQSVCDRLGPHPAVSDLNLVDQEITRVAASLDRFLALARPQQPNPSENDLIPLIKRCLALISARAERQRVILELREPNDPVRVKVDTEQIHQVLVNLSLNSLDAMPEGGRLKVEVDTTAEHVIVRFYDEGPGLGPEASERLFTPFFTTKETGLGLGLVVSRRIVTSHLGQLTAHNRPEGGACFTLQLPSCPPGTYGHPDSGNR